ncbi:MAG: TonB-dependent receptor [bacterium]|nr:TonB-dependent receptor [bacterium]
MIALIITISLMVMDTTFSKEEYPLYRMEEIVVTATRIQQYLRDVPVATTVITRADIDATNAKDVGELLRGVVGVDIKSYGTLGAMSSVSLRGSTSQQVLVLVDGRPVNSISTGECDLSKISLDDILRIEIVRCPTSHLYGANALGGVVNIITREPPKKLTTTGYGSYGRFNTQIYRLDHGGSIDNFGWLVTGGIKKSNGFRANSDYIANDLAVKSGYKFKNGLKAKVNLLFHSDNLGVPGCVPPEGNPAKYGNEEVTSLFDRQKDLNISSSLDFVYEVSGFLTLMSKSFFDQNKLNYRCRYDDWLTLDTLDEDDEYLSKIIGSSLQYQLNFRKFLSTGGVELRNTNHKVRQVITDRNTGDDTTINWNPVSVEYGVWFESHQRVLNLFEFNEGLRYDHHSKYGSKISPSIGAICWLSDRDIIRSSIGKAYRAPTFNDLYWPVGGNPNLKCESGWNSEVGLKHLFYKNLVADLSIFTLNTKDKIAWAPDTGGIWRPQNVNMHSCKGGELELNGNFKDKLLVGLTYAYLDAKQTNREIIYSDWMTGEVRQEFKTRIAAFTPRYEIGTNVTLKPATGTQLNLRARFVDKRVNYYPNYENVPVVTVDTKPLNSCWVMDAKFTQRMGNLKLEIGIDNIFNKDYIEQFGTSFKDRGYPMPLRTYIIGMNYGF